MSVLISQKLIVRRAKTHCCWGMLKNRAAQMKVFRFSFKLSWLFLHYEANTIYGKGLVCGKAVRIHLESCCEYLFGRSLP